MKLIELTTTIPINEAIENMINHNYNSLEILVELALTYSISLDEVIQLVEKAPPGKQAEKWILDRKQDFKKRYGKDWAKVLYATAWKRFNVKEENTLDLSEYPAELKECFKDTKTTTGFITDNRIVGKIANKLLTSSAFSMAQVMRLSESLKEYNRVNKKHNYNKSSKIIRLR